MKKQSLQRNIPTIAMVIAIGFTMVYYLLIYIPDNEKGVLSRGARQLNTMGQNFNELYKVYDDAIAAANGDSSFIDPSLKLVPLAATPTNGVVHYENEHFLRFQTLFRINPKTKAKEHYMKSFSEFVRQIEDYSLFDDIIVVGVDSLYGNVLDESQLNIGSYDVPDSLPKTDVQIRKVDISAKVYYAFHRRIDFNDTHFAIVGLISKKNFDARTRHVDPTITIFFLLGVLLLMLAWPVLKLLLINKHERLTTKDIQLTNYAVILGVAFVTMLILGAYYFLLSKPADTDDTLKSLSGKIANGFHREIKDRQEILTGPELFDRALTTKFNVKNLLNLSFDYNEIFSVDSIGRVKDLIVEPSNHLYDKSFKPESVDVKTRPYFHKLKELASKDTGIYYFQSIKSRTTGLQECAISTFFLVDGPNVEKSKMEIRVITSPLRSVIDPILPLNFGFAVIDRQGVVQFHSDPGKVINENFLEECGNDNKLQSFLSNQTSGYFDLTYGDNRCRMYVRPLEVVDWYLLTFYEKKHTDTFASVVISFTLASFAVIMLYIILLHQLLRLDSVVPKVVKGRSFFYRWLDPINISQNKLVSLIFFLCGIVAFDIVWICIGESIIGSLTWALTSTSISYFTVYHFLRLTRDKIKFTLFERILLILILSFAILFVVNAFQQHTTHIIFIIAALIYFLLMLGVAHWSNKWFRKFLGIHRFLRNVVRRFLSQRDYWCFRFFILSFLLVLAILPSSTFFFDHLEHERIVRTRKALLVRETRMHPTNFEEIVALKNLTYRPINYETSFKERDSLGETDNPYFSPLDTRFYNNTINYFGQDERDHRGLVLDPDSSRFDFRHNEDIVWIKNQKSFFSNDSKAVYSSMLMTNFPHNLWGSNGGFLISLVIVIILLGFGLFKLILEIARHVFYLPLRFVPSISEKHNRLDDHNQDESIGCEIINAFTTDDGVVLKNKDSLFSKILEYEKGESHKINLHSLEGQYDKESARFEQNTFIISKKFEEDFIYEWTYKLKDEERFFLYDLAEDGIVNQQDVNIIQKLYEKNLIRIMPLEIAHPSITHLIMEMAGQEYLSEMKTKAREEGRWSHFKIPFGLVIVAILGFLSIAEEGLYTRIGAILTSVGVVLPQLLEIISSIKLGKKA